MFFPYRGELKKIILVGLLALISAAACSDGMPKEFAAPEFVLKDLFDGSDIRSADLKGRPVILYFFASW